MFQNDNSPMLEPDFTSFGSSDEYDYEDYSTDLDYPTEEDYPDIRFEQVDDNVFNADPIEIFPAPPAAQAEQSPKVQENEVVTLEDSIDFSQATRNSDGKLCVLKEQMVESVVRQPLMQCTHRQVEKCHYTYVTQFVPSQEEVS